MIKRIVKFKPATEPGTPSTKGFTLVELLVVISIIAILAFLALPAIQGLQKGGGFAKAVYDISDSLNLARSYALANNTYVFVGLTEVDRTQSITAAPQTTGMGRVALAMVASKDGTNNPASGNLTQVRPTQIFDFLHIDTTSTASWPTTLNMTRPTGATIYNLGQHANTVPTSTFSVPLGGTA